MSQDTEIKRCCGAACVKEDETCEGDVIVYDEITTEDDWYWVHMCKKHAKESDDAYSALVAREKSE